MKIEKILIKISVTVHGQGYEKPFGDGFVGAPCSRGAFYVVSSKVYCVSPLPHGNRLVKHIRLAPIYVTLKHAEDGYLRKRTCLIVLLLYRTY